MTHLSIASFTLYPTYQKKSVYGTVYKSIAGDIGPFLYFNITKSINIHARYQMMGEPCSKMRILIIMMNYQTFEAENKALLCVIAFTFAWMCVAELLH